MNPVDSMMLFEIRDGRPTAQLPLGLTVDGVNVLTPEQCSARFGRTPAEWADEWKSVWGRYLAVLDPSIPTSELAVATVARVAAWDIVRAVRFPHLSEEQWSFVSEDCRRRRLDPRDVWVKLVTNKDTDKVEPLIITTIRAFRQIADRTGLRRGESPPEFCASEADTLWGPSPWRGQVAPFAARVFVSRKDTDEAFEGIAYWKFCAQFTRDAQDKVVLTECWDRGGPHMLGKCASSAAYRLAFPNECGGLYTTDEIEIPRTSSQRPAAEDAAADAPSTPVSEPAVFREAPANSASGLPDDPRVVSKLIDETTPDLERLPIELVYTGAAPTVSHAKSIIDEGRRRWPRLFAGHAHAFCAAVIHHARQRAEAVPVSA